MILWRPRNLWYRKTMDDDSTWKGDLPEKGKCTRLVVICENAVNSGQHWPDPDTNYILDSRVADEITKLEVVVDGNHAIKSLTGLQAQILSFYRNKMVPPDRIWDPSLGPQWSVFIMDFGRYFGDPEYYLDWSRHETAELRVTNDVDATVLRDLILTVEEWIPYGETLPESKGVFVDRELKSYTTTQNGEEPTKIPTTDPIRSLALQVIPEATSSAPYHWNRWPYLCVETVDLSFLEEKAKILDGFYTKRVMENNAQRYGFPTVGGKGYTHEAGVAMLSGVGYRFGSPTSFADIVGTALITNFVGLYTWQDNPMTVTSQAWANAYFDFLVWGMAYQDSYMLFDAMDPVQQNLITKDQAPVRLKINTENHANAADATVNLLLSTLELYGAGLGKS